MILFELYLSQQLPSIRQTATLGNFSKVLSSCLNHAKASATFKKVPPRSAWATHGFIKGKIAAEKICFIRLDESPDVLGRPALNTLIPQRNQKVVQAYWVLQQYSIRPCPSLYPYWHWEIFRLSTENALQDCTRQFSDVSHLIHVAIGAALEWIF